MRSACPGCLRPILADDFHFFSSWKKIVLTVVVETKGRKTGYDKTEQFHMIPVKQLSKH